MPSPELPARSLADVKLAELFDGPGCPLCGQRSRSAAAYIRAFLYESVVDVGFRRELDRSRGFCQPHTRQILAVNRAESGGTLGASILLGAVLAIRGRELDAVMGSGSRTRPKRASEAARAPACPVCRVEEESLASAIPSLHRLATDEAWGEAIARAPLCLDHLVALIVHRPAGESWDRIERLQDARVRDIRHRLERFAKHSSHDRRHHLTDDERDAADHAAALLGGG
ncbi:MAG TPA: DUF6062 family protein [Candidatus Limnocylindria bacterium]|nr:DUF6062 family protein [Candidatus Limnocylindria bacterium]